MRAPAPGRALSNTPLITSPSGPHARNNSDAELDKLTDRLANASRNLSDSPIMGAIDQPGGTSAGLNGPVSRSHRTLSSSPINVPPDRAISNSPLMLTSPDKDSADEGPSASGMGHNRKRAGKALGAPLRHGHSYKPHGAGVSSDDPDWLSDDMINGSDDFLLHDDDGPPGVLGNSPPPLGVNAAVKMPSPQHRTAPAAGFKLADWPGAKSSLAASSVSSPSAPAKVGVAHPRGAASATATPVKQKPADRPTVVRSPLSATQPPHR